jgi:hypothetical protein
MLIYNSALNWLLWENIFPGTPQVLRKPAILACALTNNFRQAAFSPFQVRFSGLT